MHYPLEQRTLHLAHSAVGQANGSLFGTASCQQAGYTRRGCAPATTTTREQPREALNGHRGGGSGTGTGQGARGAVAGWHKPVGQEEVPFW